MDRPARLVDPRQPRVGQAITATVLAVGFLLDWPVVIPVIAGILAGASLVGGRANPYVHIFRAVKRILAWGPPAELEEAAPPRFANILGFLFTGAASVLYYGPGATEVAWGLALLVSALALLAATTGLCVGCEMYVIGRRLLARRRVGAST
jgi:hypothetical protein